MFAVIPDENIIFFNEYNRATYSKFFARSYSNSVILPIGIILPKTVGEIRRSYVNGKLVSIGNLVKFKTYNEHVIRVVADLIGDYPELTYDIYGEGDQYEVLQKLAIELGLLSVVSFKGRIPYDQFSTAVTSSMAFIGSGTALVEAAALAVPSVVGIESIDEPKTYGFLSDISGFSYNEKIDGVPLVEIKSLIVQLLTSSSADISTIGNKCAQKAAEFSIGKTVEGFLQLCKRSSATKFSVWDVYWLLLMFDFLRLALLDLLRVDRSLRNRRNQSSI